MIDRCITSGHYKAVVALVALRNHLQERPQFEAEAARVGLLVASLQYHGDPWIPGVLERAIEVVVELKTPAWKTTPQDIEAATTALSSLIQFAGTFEVVLP